MSQLDGYRVPPGSSLHYNRKNGNKVEWIGGLDTVETDAKGL